MTTAAIATTSIIVEEDLNKFYGPLKCNNIVFLCAIGNATKDWKEVKTECRETRTMKVV